jgi:hypothetical protein
MSTLFEVLAQGVQVEPHVLQQKICNYLALDGPLGSESVSQCLNRNTELHGSMYIARMRQNYKGGGAIEVQAFCELYRIRVYLTESATVQYFFEPHNQAFVRTLHLLWNGQQFELL